MSRDNYDLRKNASGYSDPTAYKAIMNAESNMSEDDHRFYKLLFSIKDIIELAGFELEGRITIKDKKTGKVWR